MKCDILREEYISFKGTVQLNFYQLTPPMEATCRSRKNK